MGQVSGKIAIVTGGASGIGAASAKLLAAEGAAVLVTDVNDTGGSEVVAAIRDAGGQADYMHHDVVHEGQWQDAFAKASDAFGPPSVLVNNAGVGRGGPIAETSLEDWRALTAINIDGVFLGTKYAIRSMRDNDGGSIVNMSSIAGLQGAVGLAGYCATKGAVRLFTKAAAVECGQNDWNIRVNSVHPGIIDTPIWETVSETRDLGATSQAAVAGANRIDPNVLANFRAPLRRVGKPEDIANAVLYLASDASSYMTGSEMVVDGGIVAGGVFRVG